LASDQKIQKRPRPRIVLHAPTLNNIHLHFRTPASSQA